MRPAGSLYLFAAFVADVNSVARRTMKDRPVWLKRSVSAPD
jgi:hypothetical protein